MTQDVDNAIALHRRVERRRLAILCSLLLLVAVFLVLDVATGPALLPVGDVLAALLRRDGEDPTLLAIS